MSWEFLTKSFPSHYKFMKLSYKNVFCYIQIINIYGWEKRPALEKLSFVSYVCKWQHATSQGEGLLLGHIFLFKLVLALHSCTLSLSGCLSVYCLLWACFAEECSLTETVIKDHVIFCQVGCLAKCQHKISSYCT